MVQPRHHSPLFPYTTLFRSYIAQAPLAVAVLVERASRFAIADAGRAVQSMVLTAWQDGVGSKDRKSTRLNSSHVENSYAVFCLKKKKFASNVITLVHTIMEP